jgi:hypothetical protein
MRWQAAKSISELPRTRNGSVHNIAGVRQKIFTSCVDDAQKVSSTPRFGWLVQEFKINAEGTDAGAAAGRTQPFRAWKLTNPLERQKSGELLAPGSPTQRRVLFSAPQYWQH